MITSKIRQASGFHTYGGVSVGGGIGVSVGGGIGVSVGGGIGVSVGGGIGVSVGGGIGVSVGGGIGVSVGGIGVKVLVGAGVFVGGGEGVLVGCGVRVGTVALGVMSVAVGGGVEVAPEDEARGVCVLVLAGGPPPGGLVGVGAVGNETLPPVVEVGVKVMNGEVAAGKRRVGVRVGV